MARPTSGNAQPLQPSVGVLRPQCLFQFSELDPRIHEQAEQQAAKTCNQPNGCMSVVTEPYHPAYFAINGRSMPDLMDPNYAVQYPHQPYNGNPHASWGTGAVADHRDWPLAAPFHEHGNHVRVLARTATCC
jgi:hypothetical protein